MTQLILMWMIQLVLIRLRNVHGYIDDVPEMCSHSSRFDSITQFLKSEPNEDKLKVKTFFSSNGFYWLLDYKQIPNIKNTRGRLPRRFRGDAAFFRQWKRCDREYEVRSSDQVVSDGLLINCLFKIVPMIVIVDSDPSKSGEPIADLRYMIYYIQEDKWSEPHPISNDPILSRTKIYRGFRTVDAILNFGNLKNSWQQIDDRLIIMSTALNNSHYYDYINVEGCVRTNGTFAIRRVQKRIRVGSLDELLWPMDTSIDAAFVYLTYPSSKGNIRRDGVEVVIFQANANYQFSVSFESGSEVTIDEDFD
jgi:hypothetical protein